MRTFRLDRRRFRLASERPCQGLTRQLVFLKWQNNFRHKLHAWRDGRLRHNAALQTLLQLVDTLHCLGKPHLQIPELLLHLRRHFAAPAFTRMFDERADYRAQDAQDHRALKRLKSCPDQQPDDDAKPHCMSSFRHLGHRRTIGATSHFLYQRHCPRQGAEF